MVQQRIPQPGLLDYLSRVDDLLVANMETLKELQQLIYVNIPDAQKLSSVDMRKKLEDGELIPYAVRKYPLDTAHTDDPIEVTGDHLAVQTDGSLDDILIRFNIQTADQVPIKWFNPWKQPFFKLFLSHTAQAGKTLYLVVGRQISATNIFELASDLINRISGVVDSTTVALGVAGTYTGSEFTCDGYGRIIGSVFADQAGTLYVDQRNDGSNWDVRSTIGVIASTATGFSVEVVGNEARLVYTNGGVAQTTFRLYGRLRRV